MSKMERWAWFLRFLTALLLLPPFVLCADIVGQYSHSPRQEELAVISDIPGRYPGWERMHRRKGDYAGDKSSADSLLEMKGDWRARPSSKSASGDTAGVMVTLSEEGLLYVKDVLVQQVLQEITPLTLPNIATKVEIPIGTVDFKLEKILLSAATVAYSDIDLMGEKGITIFAGGLQASMSLHWSYKYTAAYIPWPIGDSGIADIHVSGMQAAATFGLHENNGTLRLAIMECGIYIEDLDISLHGGASWLYQWFVYLFDYQIRSSIQIALTEKIIQAADELDNLLLNLPRIAPIDEDVGIDLTIVQDPLLSPTYLSVGAKGEFVSLQGQQSGGANLPKTQLPTGVFCTDDKLKMISIALSDTELNSASRVFYESGALRWVVDDIAGQAILNTASWKYIAPQLYKKYPNQDMQLDFVVSAPPQIGLSPAGVSVAAATDMLIEVLGSDGSDEEVIAVASVSLDISMDAVVSIVDNNITAQASLGDFTMALDWSDVGTFPVKLVEVAVQTVLNKVILPLINVALKKGFPLPVVPAVEIKNADLKYETGYILVCADVEYQEGYLI